MINLREALMAGKDVHLRFQIQIQILEQKISAKELIDWV